MSVGREYILGSMLMAPVTKILLMGLKVLLLMHVSS